jgi:hypothetical protein
MLTAFLLPSTQQQIDTSALFLDAISSGKYTMAIETAWPLYLTMSDKNFTQEGVMGEISKAIMKYGVKSVSEDLTAVEVGTHTHTHTHTHTYR